MPAKIYKFPPRSGPPSIIRDNEAIRDHTAHAVFFASFSGIALALAPAALSAVSVYAALALVGLSCGCAWSAWKYHREMCEAMLNSVWWEGHDSGWCDGREYDCDCEYGQKAVL